jgi:hypothetical protein
MRFYWLILAVLGVWRITHLLHAEDGPRGLLARFRRSLGEGMLGQILDCFYCLSVWTAVPFAWVIGQSWKEKLLLWPALSGAAVLLERLTAREEKIPPAGYFEDKEPCDVLRKESNEQFTDQDIFPNR